MNRNLPKTGDHMVVRRSPRELGQSVRNGRRGRIDPEAMAREEYGLEVVTQPISAQRGYEVRGRTLTISDRLDGDGRRWAVASALGYYLMTGDTPVG